MRASSTSTPTLGVTIADTWGTYTASIVRALAAATRARDGRVRFFVGQSPAELLARLPSMRPEDRIDALVAAGPDVTTGAQQWFAGSKLAVPVVTFGAVLDGAPSVMCDNAGGVRAAVLHLAALGRRRFAFVRGPLGNRESDERLRGFREGLDQAGLELDPALVAPGAFAEASGSQAVRLFVDDRGSKLDAVIAANDLSAIGVVRALSHRGIRVPEDVSVVGFDGFIEGLACDPPLTTIRQPIDEMAARAVDSLLARLAGEVVPERVTLPTDLTVRRSCGGRSPQREPRTSARETADKLEAAHAHALLAASRQERELGALTLSLLAAHDTRQVIEALREHHGILNLKNLHLLVLDDDPAWTRVLFSTVLGQAPIRFRSEQFLPQGALAHPECAFVIELQRDAPLGRLVLECDADQPPGLNFLALRIAAALERIRDQRNVETFSEREHAPSGTRGPLSVGRYHVVRRISEGTPATVYLAEYESAQGERCPVALELVNPRVSRGGSGSVLQLMEEVRVAAAIQHPNVNSVIDLVFQEGALYLVMDYVEGDSLAGLLRRADKLGETLPIRIVGRIVADTLDGLHAAHECRSPDGMPLSLVHRGMSPKNVLVGIDGVTRVADFGVTSTRDSVPGMGASASEIVSDVRYIAPEQALGMPLDRRCDLWAVGVIAWEALAGQSLHTQQMDVAALLTLISDPPPPLRSVRSDVPEDIERTIERVLRVDANERFFTAAEFRDALVDAWRSAGGIADSAVTAQYVRDLVARTSDREPASQLTRTG